MEERPKGWDGTRYRGVIVYAMMESIDYHRVDVDEGGGLRFGRWEVGEVAEPDHDPQIWGWNIFDSFAGSIEETLTVEQLPSLEDVERFINKKLESNNGISS